MNDRLHHEVNSAVSAYFALSEGGAPPNLKDGWWGLMILIIVNNFIYHTHTHIHTSYEFFKFEFLRFKNI